MPTNEHCSTWKLFVIKRLEVKSSLLAAPFGNQNAKNGKLWENALKRAIARRAKGDLEHGLDTLADKVIEAVTQGEQWAALEVGNRLDGKPSQTVEATVDVGNGLLAVLAGLGKSANS